MLDIPGWSSIGSSDLVAIKFGTAAAAAVLLTLKLRRGATGAWERRFDIALVCLALLAAASWWNLGRFHFPNYWHRHELFHYYLATKYQAELGYSRLYDCVALAERDADPSPKLATRWTRDLRTNEVVAGAPALRDPSLCRPFFSSERWADFQKDVLFFRSSVSSSKWMQMQRDHGYNGTPVWTVLGHVLANTGPATTFQITALTLLDPLLLLIMWATVWWAFGWRVTAIALIWWGTNYPARFNYIGGGFLRSDYLVTMIVSLVLAKQGRMFASGIAFGLATLFRVFPGFAAVGLLLNQIPQIWRVARGQVPVSSLPLLRFVGACALMAALLVPASGAIVGGGVSRIFDTWTAFVGNSQKHLSGYSTNRVGLKTAVAYDPRSRYVDIGTVYYVDSPGDTWQVARHRAFRERRPLYWIVVAMYLVLLARAVRGQPEWVALVVGIGLLPIISNITCYYYGFFLAYAFLWQRYPWIGPALCALSAYTCLVVAVLPSEEDVYAAISYGLIFYSFAVTGRLAWQNWHPVTSTEPLTSDAAPRSA